MAQEIADPAEVGIIFQSNEPIVPEIARQAHGRREIRLAVEPKPTSTIGLTMNSHCESRYADDGSNFQIPAG